MIDLDLLLIGLLVFNAIGLTFFAFAHYMAWRYRQRTARHVDAAPDAPTPPAIPDASRSPPMPCLCCICRGTIMWGGGAEQAHPLDPCSLVLVGNSDRCRQDQREILFICHFECFQRVAGDGCLAMTDPDFWTVGRAGGGVLGNLPPGYGAGGSCRSTST